MRLITLAVVAALTSGFAQAQSVDPRQAINALPWQRGSTFSIADVAQIPLPPQVRALSLGQASKFLELQGNPPSSGTYVVSANDDQWFALFTFDPSGHVKDDERIDADELLATLKQSNRAAQAERKRLGIPVLVLEGWYTAPHYDLASKRLEWGTRLTSDGNPLINYTAKVLGRSGVLNALLVSDPSTFEQDLKSFHSLLQRVSFVSGQSYAEFRPGDKVAEYGLAALVVGGAAAVAAKAGGGFLKAIGVGILALVVGAFSALKRLFRKKDPVA